MKANLIKITKNHHFWIIVAISIILLVLYSAWPWRTTLFPGFIQSWMPWAGNLYQLALIEISNRVVGILFFIPIVYASIIFSWKGTLATSLAAFLGILPIIIGWDLTALISNLLIIILPFLLVSLSAFEFDRRRKEKTLAEEREKERKIYLSKILKAGEIERQMIAQDLHDDTIQDLLVIRRMVDSLSLDNNADNMKQKSTSISEICDNSVENLRRICLRLRPDILDKFGLVPALRWLVEQMNERGNTRIKVSVEGEERRLSANSEITLFRIVQEALNNVIRHSQASSAIVELVFNDSHIKITITDNGMGFNAMSKLDLLAVQGKLGLVGMRQRTETLGGSFNIKSGPGEGTQILISVENSLLN